MSTAVSVVRDLPYGSALIRTYKVDSRKTFLAVIVRKPLHPAKQYQVVSRYLNGSSRAEAAFLHLKSLASSNWHLKTLFIGGSSILSLLVVVASYTTSGLPNPSDSRLAFQTCFSQVEATRSSCCDDKSKSMIEKTNDACMSVDFPVMEEKEKSPSQKHALNTKSLMEDEDEEDDEEELAKFPRSTARIVLPLDRSSKDNIRMGETRETMSDRAIHCEPFIVPICQGGIPLFPACQGDALAEQIDMMTVRNFDFPFVELYHSNSHHHNAFVTFFNSQQCRHPLELFSMFHDHRAPHLEAVDHLLPGMHVLPRTCEYCGASDTDLCTKECQRPKSFFRKSRPPFCPPDRSQWDPVTGFVVKPKQLKGRKEEKTTTAQPEMGEPSSLLKIGDLFL